MDRESTLSLLAQLFPNLVKFTQATFEHFDEWIPAQFRVAVEDSQAKLVNETMMVYLEMEYGTSKRRPVRIEKENGLKYLFVEGVDFDIGVRFKKLGRDFRSYNHKSGQQDELRKDRSFRCFPCMERETAHIFLGYKQSDSLQPSLTHIAITCEGPEGIDWKHLIWTAEADIKPIQENQPDFLPPEPRIKPKRRKDKGSERNEDKETG